MSTCPECSLAYPLVSGHPTFDWHNGTHSRHLLKQSTTGPSRAILLFCSQARHTLSWSPDTTFGPLRVTAQACLKPIAGLLPLGSAARMSGWNCRQPSLQSKQ